MSTFYRKPEKIDSALQRFLKETGIWGAYRQHQLLERWPEAAGEIIARVTSAERVEYGRLYVRVENSSWRNELHFYKAELIERLNEIAGEQVIKEIIFV